MGSWKGPGMDCTMDMGRNISTGLLLLRESLCMAAANGTVCWREDFLHLGVWGCRAGDSQ
jgi:hypothetical protein